MKQVLAYCRAGFESECGAELQEVATDLQAWGFIRAKNDTAYTIYECQETSGGEAMFKVPVNKLIFARQLMVGESVVFDMTDRLAAILPVAAQLGPVCDVRLEVPDTNEGKALNRLAKKLATPLKRALQEQGSIQSSKQGKVLHVCLFSGQHGFVGISHTRRNSPWLNGIPRLRQPASAPSRSSLKLDEAFLTLLDDEMRAERVRSGQKAVDLGACPGGWTYQLVRRGMFVSAVDNGSMDQALMESGQVQHFKEDGFRYEPKRKNITWLVCDMVEKPTRVTELILGWFERGWCEDAIFNLKLPMKKRYEMASDCLVRIRELMDQLDMKYGLKAKHLYHDREEITVYLYRLNQRTYQ